jgi:iron complex outermembrane receptor protein
MFRKTKICTGLMLAFGGSLALTAPAAFGQAQTQQLERVEITGSSVKRIAVEGALPVITIKKEEIEKSGATSVVDLMQKLPAIQGQVGESGAVGGTTFGFSGVSVHNLGEQRTLVLLNGHRLTQFGGQQLTGFAAAFDLNSLPLSSIERIEVLTDGASALYGSDAVAGVVNFITRRDFNDGDFSLGYTAPRGGAEEMRFSVTKGFGSMDTDGYNVALTYGHDERTELASTSRSFAKTGQVFFSANGKNYRFQQFSVSPIPANATDDNGNLINPYRIATGSCAPNSFRVIDSGGDYCGFDFVSTLKIYPERTRDNVFITSGKRLGPHDLFLDILYSRTNEVDRIAPVPGGLPIPAGSALFNKYLAPLGVTQDSTAFYRVADLGPRTNYNTSYFYDIAGGSKGTVAGWDYKATLTQSRSDVRGDISGYPGALALSGLRASGLLDPFVLPGQQSQAAQEALSAINYKGYFDGGIARLTTAQLNGSKEIAQMPAGPLLLGTGVNFNREQFEARPSLFAQGLLADPVKQILCDPTGANPALPCDQRFGDAAASNPYQASRNSWGAFGELVIPALKQLEFGLAARYDHYSDFGSRTTGKGSFRYTALPNLLIRGSYGTGFRAPTVPQLNAAPRSFGVTSDNYTCTPELQQVATANNAVCRPGSAQYDVLAAGNKNLLPEKSKQATLGIRYEPISSISAGADLWWVAIRDVFGQLTEQTVFANPTAYPGAWSSQKDVATGINYLAFNNGNLNLGKQYSTGLDLDVSGRFRTGVGTITSQILATYMIREDQQLQAGGQYYTAIGQNSDALGVVTFRWQGRWQTTLQGSNWNTTLAMNFKTGYKDQTQTVDVLDNNGNVTGQEDINLHVPSYTTFDLQGQWNPIKPLTLTVGLLNMFDRNPPFSLVTGGTNKGQQFGYDDRYYDPRGRTWYFNASYKF